MGSDNTNKHELYFVPIFSFTNENSLSASIVIRTFYSYTNDRIPGSYVN
jgi:hypothetical protein